MRQAFGRAIGQPQVVAAGIAAVLILLATDAFGCPNCKDAVNTSDPEGLNVARGYFYSILLMLAMPFTLAGSFGAYVWREMRRQRAQTGADESMIADLSERQSS
ncbi:MAG: hypothetical protein K8S94_06525 [Planctomycetia bacterium]|nr:hypothetical protein [Planctomycetia bacterium]